jgi:ABC-type antimicrobial peptide transport system permease subunit
MNIRTLIRRSLRFHARSHLSVMLGAAVGSAALIGALVVGDSVRGSLRETAVKRLSFADLELFSGDRFFREDLPVRWSHLALTNHPNKMGGQVWADHQDGLVTALRLPCLISTADATRRVNDAQVFGFSDYTGAWYDVRTGQATPPWGDEAWKRELVGPLPGYVELNDALAERLSVRLGDEVILRVGPTANGISELAVNAKNTGGVVLRLKVGGVRNSSLFGDFSDKVGPTPPLNAFVDLHSLQAATGLSNQLNAIFSRGMVKSWVGPVLLVRAEQVLWKTSLKRLDFLFGSFIGEKHTPLSALETLAILAEEMRSAIQLVDLGADLQIQTRQVELRSKRVFPDQPLARAALAAATNAQPIFTYLANLLRASTNTTPYSMVTAAGSPWTPTDMRDDEIIVSQWLADDLQARAGDLMELIYFLPESGAKLIQATNRFRVRAVVPMEMPWADRTLMPDFPGIEKAESTRDWDAGFPLVYKIRPKDEDYWKKYRGTPKAFLTLAAGQKMWGNRFGNLTAIRLPAPPGSSAEKYRAAIEKKILAKLKPEEFGLRFEPVREQALKAAEQSQDFGQLFLGFSLFLIIAALLMMALLFQLGLEQRAREVGTLLALGFNPKQVRRLLLGEGLPLAFVGGVLGVLGGIAYARAMLHGLVTLWRNAVGAATLSFHVTSQTLVIGLFASVLVSVATIWLTLRKFMRRPARELLVNEVRNPKVNGQKRAGRVGILAFALAIGLVTWTILKGDTVNAGAFFAAGALLLLAGLGFISAWLAQLAAGPCVSATFKLRPAEAMAPGELNLKTASNTQLTLAALALRGCARRRKRSLATVAMLSCGSFLIVAIGVFRLDANRDATRRASGTGGFALIGETTMPVVQELNSKAGRDFFALKASDLEGISFVPFRVHEGDEASCLNLNRAQTPRLLGVRPELLADRFTFARTGKKGVGWELLCGPARESAVKANKKDQPRSHERGDEDTVEIPAVGDANSIEWALHKKVGDTLDYVDERGQPFKMRIVGAVANSILQGSLIIDEAEFMKRFPSESGYRQFLIDAPTNAASQVSATLSRAMQDVGLELTPTVQRLAQFNAVQNTYLGTFQILGGLGLLLGSVGLGVVVLRNVLESRGELALLLAVGFRARTVQRLVLAEHGALLGLGLAIGIVAAAVAVLPALRSPGAHLPYASLALTLAAILANGALWTWLATRFALRGNLLNALRNE